MKTKILFFFLLLVVGVGNGFAENTSRDSLFQEIKNARTFAKNWDTIPGSDNDKVIAILTGKTILVEDSRIAVCTRRFGVLLLQEVYYTRHIYYDETNKLFKEKITFFQKKYDLAWIFLNLCCQPLLLLVICTGTRYLYEDYHTTLCWIAWCFFLGILIFVSCYLGTLCGIISLIYIFKDKMKESIENFLQKRKEKKENKEQD